MSGLLPNQIAKSETEDSEQAALFAYVNVARLVGFDLADLWSDTGVVPNSDYKRTGIPALPQLEWFHAIPNGGSRGDSKRGAMIRGAQLRATGVKKGVADTFLPWSNRAGYHGLYIEMKKRNLKPKSKTAKGGMSDEQIVFRDYCLANGYQFAVCYGWQEAVLAIKNYVEYLAPVPENRINPRGI